MPRFHCAVPLHAGTTLALPAGAARHVQVLRLQPGDTITLFDGSGGEYAATVERMGRSEVSVTVGAHTARESEAARAVHLAVGMPANERMDMLVEKATELGVVAIQPLLTDRSVLRLDGERAKRKCAHWQAVAVAACEQCGRARVPQVEPVLHLRDWLPQAGPGVRLLLSLAPDAAPLPVAASGPVVSLSGPEGGLSPDEERQARARGFVPAALGPRTLRADTAPLALLAWLGLNSLR